MPEGVLHGGAIVGMNVSEEAAVKYYGGLRWKGVLNSKEFIYLFFLWLDMSFLVCLI